MSNETNRQEAEYILASLQSSAAATQHSTNEQDAPRRFIDVHIYDLPRESEGQDEQSSVESTDALSPDPEYDQETVAPSRRRRPLLVPLVVAACCLLLTGVMIVVWSVLPLLTPSATITIVPISVPVRAASTVTIGGPGAQVSGRSLATLTMSQARTIPTTGKGHQDAKASYGFITLYNAALRVQVVPAGTVLTTAYGIQVMTEQDAAIPAGSLATNGHTTVAAYAVLTGPGGNMEAGAIYGPCCRVNVFAASSAFTGGQAARDYPMVRQADTDGAAQALTTSLVQSVTLAVQGQVHPDETLLTPLACTPKITTDHQPGDEATQVSVTVDETCTGHTYQTQALHDAAIHLLTQAAIKQVGVHYGLMGTIETSITKTIVTKQNTVELEITSAGTWTYQFTDDEVQQLKAQVAGKGQEQARTLLLHTPGVQMVSISLSRGETVPEETSKIAVVWLNYAAQDHEKGTNGNA